MTYYAHSNSEKCYVEHYDFGCVARLCKMSAEYYSVDNQGYFTPIEVNFRPSFKEFQRKCEELYKVEISDLLCPKAFVNANGDYFPPEGDVNE